MCSLGVYKYYFFFRSIQPQNSCNEFKDRQIDIEIDAVAVAVAIAIGTVDANVIISIW